MILDVRVRILCVGWLLNIILPQEDFVPIILKFSCLGIPPKTRLYGVYAKMKQKEKLQSTCVNFRLRSWALDDLGPLDAAQVYTSYRALRALATLSSSPETNIEIIQNLAVRLLLMPTTIIRFNATEVSHQSTGFSHGEKDSFRSGSGPRMELLEYDLGVYHPSLLYPSIYKS
ncbi:hypothetical protein F5Y05DRAFT_209579 [Hypoxylon sp. FL0543]|nr:hypothetical protein F5Y05DRAFT_209579 [Hypoxylon sp. FL0543]